MNRQKLKKRIENYNKNGVLEISHALEIINSGDSSALTNEEIGKVWERISKSLDVNFSDDENHDAWALEEELKKLYKYDQPKVITKTSYNLTSFFKGIYKKYKSSTIDNLGVLGAVFCLVILINIIIIIGYFWVTGLYDLILPFFDEILKESFFMSKLIVSFAIILWCVIVYVGLLVTLFTYKSQALKIEKWFSEIIEIGTNNE